MRYTTFLSTEPPQDECYASRASFQTGAFIAQIAAMKTAFARGKIANVNTNAVRGHIVMLTNESLSRHTCRRHAGPSSA
jgi:hypothetical protein